MTVLLNNILKFSAIFLAPLAGYTDQPFRKICRTFSHITTLTEMVSSNAIVYNNKKTLDMCEICEDNRPVGIQIFGGDPVIMREAAIIVENKYKPDLIDINMGCPVQKVVKNGYGSALMKTPELVKKILKEIKNNIKIPLTVKIRSGWDHKNINAVEIAKIAEDSGVDIITVHGRTKTDMFSENCDLSVIKNVKDSVKIPVIANGDIIDNKSFLETLKITGTDGIMVGRASIGCPWIFEKIINKKEFNIKERFDIAKKHFEFSIKYYKNEKRAALLMRKHFFKYFSGIKNASSIRKRFNQLETMNEFKDIYKEFIL